MALTPVGVKFISEGYKEFITSLGEATKAIVNLGRMTENRLKALAIIDDMFEKATAASNEFAKSQNNLSTQLGNINYQFDSLTSNMQRSQGVFGSFARVIGGAFKGAIAGLSAGLVFPTVGEEIPLAIAGAILGGLNAIWGEVSNGIDRFWDRVGERIAAAQGVLARIGEAGVKLLGGIIDMIRWVVSSALRTVTGLIFGLFSSIGKLFGSGGGGLGDSLLGAMIRFEILKQVIRKVILEVKTLAKEAANSAIELQTLEIRIQSLVASQVRAAGVTDDYAKSMQLASGYTQELFDWMQRLALETPIGIDAISHTTSLAIAMGWGIDSAKELTEAIVNFSTGAGLSNDVMERIIYNFAQMRSAGKVTGTELRDLARGAFLPVNKILDVAAQNLGIAADSMQEFREAAASGAIDVQTFFDAFIQVINTDFPDAARRMNYTFAAVKDNLHDVFKTIIGWNILTPIIESITKPMQNFLNMFREPQMIMLTKVLGKSLVEVFDGLKSALASVWQSIKSVFRAILPEVEQPINRLRGELGRMYEELDFGKFEGIIIFFVKLGATIEMLGKKIANAIQEKIVPAAEKLGDKLDGTFSSIAEDAFGWGAKMITNFAAGIARGIAGVLTTTMNAISAFLRFWLQPGSPPRVAPQIDIWGMETIAEWLHGFTMADFDVLDSLENALRGSLEALSFLGVIGEDAVLPTLRDITVELISALDVFNQTGEMSAEIFERLRRIGGVYGDELATLLQLQIDLAVATERVAVAQEAYNAAVEATRLQTRTTNSLIRSYNAMLRGGADRSTLDQMLLEVQAAQTQLYLDRQRELAAQEELQAAEDALDPIREAVELQERLIQQLIELARLEQEIANSRASGGGAGGEVDNEFDPTALLPTGGAGAIEWERLFDYFKQIALNELGPLWDDLGVIWGDPFAPVRTAWDELMHHIEQTWNIFSSVFGFGSFENTFGTTFDPYANLPSTVPSWIQDYDPFRGDAPTEVTLLYQVLTDVRTAFEKVRDALEDVDWGTVIDDVADVFSDIWEALKDIEWDNVGDFITGVTEGLSNVDWKAVGDGLSGIASFLSGNLGLLGGAGAAIGSYALGGYELGIPVTFVVGNAMGVARIPDIAAWVLNNLINPYLEALGMETTVADSQNFIEVGRSIPRSIFAGIIGYFTDSLDTINNWMNEYVVNPVRDALGLGEGDQESDKFTQIGESLVEGLYDGFIGKLIENATWITEWLTEHIILPVRKFFGIGSPSTVFAEFGVDIIQGLFDGIESMLINAWSTLSGWFDNNIIKPIEAFFGIGKGKSTDNPMYNVGAGAIENLIAGIESKWQDVKRAVEWLAGLIPGWIMNILGEHSPSDVLFQIGAYAVEGLIDGIESLAGPLLDAVVGLAESIGDAFDDKFKIESPSEVFADKGKNLMRGLASGITSASGMVNKALGSVIGSNFSLGRANMPTTMNAMPVRGGNTVNFGDVTVNNTMDWAMFKSKVQRAILEA